MNKPKLGIIAYKALSGGVIVIFEHAYYLTLRNQYEVFLIFDTEVTDEDISWFDRATTLNKISFEEAKNIHFDIVIATFWKSCYEIAELKSNSYLYFNQSVESKFYKDSPQKAALAEATYLLGLPIITEATWIKNYLNEHYHIDAELAKNGINKEVFFVQQEKEKNRPFRVLVEGPLGVDFKNVNRTLEICKQSKADEIWLLTSTEVDQIEGVHQVFSKIPIHKVQEVYNSCDVLVKLSKVEGMFGPPLEMFHCGGTAITYNVSGFDEYMKHNHNALIADMDDEEKVLEYINFLKDHPEELERLKQNALITANEWPNWEQASRGFEQAIEKSLAKEQVTQEQLKYKIKTIETLCSSHNVQEQKIVQEHILVRVYRKLKYLYKKHVL